MEANSFQNCLWVQPREKLDLERCRDRRQERVAAELWGVCDPYWALCPLCSTPYWAQGSRN